MDEASIGRRAPRPGRISKKVSVAAGMLGVVAVLFVLPACVPPRPPTQSGQDVCAGDISIARVDVTVQSASPTGWIRLERRSSTQWEPMLDLISMPPAPLVVGQTYTLAAAGWGLVDLGRCMQLTSSPDVTYQLALSLVVDPQAMFYYALFGGRLDPKAWRGTWPSGSTPPSGPVDVVGISGAGDLDAGSHTCAVVSGAVKCWGPNFVGGLGDGTTVASNTPVTAVGVSDATQVSVGGLTTCALRTGGSISCWGLNYWGSLGNGTTGVNSSVPVAVVGISGASRVASGYQHSCAIVAGGAVKCWGFNDQGQLGDGTTTDSNVPVDVVGISGATAIGASRSHSCAVLTGGSMSCWGSNDQGQLGNGSTTGSPLPVAVSGISDAIDVAVGEGFTCALRSDGAVKCWGNNYSGQLGDGTFIDSSVPVEVSGISDAVGLTAEAHACAWNAAGVVRCWGPNADGELGNGTRIASGVPVSVVGLAGATQVAAASSRSCAIAGGGVKCWGDAWLGNGS